MKAAIINKWGSPDVFEWVETAPPVPSRNQILVKVFCTSVNPVDFKQRKGNHRFILGSPFPITLGYDVCGEVVETGSEITRFSVGDIVFGDLNNKYGGALAEYAVGTENCFALKPKNCSIEEAAAFPLISLTALQALKYKANLQPGQTIIINGASGGVGHIAVQIASNLGAKTIAVASEKNKELVMQFNPDTFIAYNKQDILKISDKADVFFDVVGNYSYVKTKHLLKPGGIYINPHPRPKILFHKLLQPFNKNKKAKTFLRNHNADDLQQIAEWIEAKKLKVLIDKKFTLETCNEAHRYAETGRTRGKNIITIH